MKQVRRSIDVNQPVDVCYRLWRQFKDFPRFMTHVQSVQPVIGSEDIWHWVVDGPMGKTVEWDALVIIDKLNSEIAWETIGDNDVESTGHVWFMPLDASHTRVSLDMAYETDTPFGEKVGGLFAHPDRMIRDDLHHFKEIAEGIKHPSTQI